MPLFLQPTPPIPIGHHEFSDIETIEAIETRGFLPGLFEEFGILEVGIKIPINKVVEIGPLEYEEDDSYYYHDSPIWVTPYSNGMLEVRPGGGPTPSDLGRLRIYKTGKQTDPILHLPQHCETVAVLADDENIFNEDSVGIVVLGLITTHEDTSLYLPHRVASLF